MIRSIGLKTALAVFLPRIPMRKTSINHLTLSALWSD